MALKTITSANAQLILTVPRAGIIAPIQGFASDDAFTTEPVQSAETRMGVDGRMSSGRLPFITPQNIVLQADSPSIAVFDAWQAAREALGDELYAEATLNLPSIQTTYLFTKGALQMFTSTPPGRKVLEPRTFTIHWERVTPAPLVVL